MNETNRLRIALIGATGGTGRHFLRLAQKAGHAVTVLARNPDKLSDLDVKVIRADGLDSESLNVLGTGFDVVVSIIGASGLRQARRVTDLYSRSTRNLIDALVAGGAHLIVVSSSGVEPQENDNWLYVNILKRFFLNPMYEDMLRMESTLADASIPYTVVRPPYLTKGKVTGEYRMQVGRSFTDDGSLRRGDLAHALLQITEASDEYRRATVWVSE